MTTNKKAKMLKNRFGEGLKAVIKIVDDDHEGTEIDVLYNGSQGEDNSAQIDTLGNEIEMREINYAVNETGREYLDGALDLGQHSFSVEVLEDGYVLIKSYDCELLVAVIDRQSPNMSESAGELFTSKLLNEEV